MSRERDAWRTFEPIHAIVYFAPEKKQAYEAAGLKGGWMGYFASRAAAMGPVPAEVVTAAFYNFHPEMVRRAIPDAWNFSSPAAVLDARLRAVDAALTRLLGGWAGSAENQELNGLLTTALDACSLAGRPLFAAHASLAPPEQPHLFMWHACTLLREHRGDGHVAALVAAGLDGCEAHVTLVGTGALPAGALQAYRGWSDEEWQAARRRLERRGLLDSEGNLTDEGHSLRSWVEDRTDRLAAAPWHALGRERTERTLQLMGRARELVLAGGDITFPNPMGLPE